MHSQQACDPEKGDKIPKPWASKEHSLCWARAKCLNPMAFLDDLLGKKAGWWLEGNDKQQPKAPSWKSHPELQGLLMGSPGSTGTPAVLPKQAGGEEMVLPGPLERKSYLKPRCGLSEMGLICSVKHMTWDLRGWKGRGKPPLFLLSIPVRFQMGKRLSFLHREAQVMLLEPKSVDTAYSDPSNHFPFEVITRPKIPSTVGPLISLLLPFHFLPSLRTFPHAVPCTWNSLPPDIYFPLLFSKDHRIQNSILSIAPLLPSLQTYLLFHVLIVCLSYIFARM